MNNGISATSQVRVTRQGYGKVRCRFFTMLAILWSGLQIIAVIIQKERSNEFGHSLSLPLWVIMTITIPLIAFILLATILGVKEKPKKYSYTIADPDGDKKLY